MLLVEQGRVEVVSVYRKNHDDVRKQQQQPKIRLCEKHILQSMRTEINETIILAYR